MTGVTEYFMVLGIQPLALLSALMQPDLQNCITKLR